MPIRIDFATPAEAPLIAGFTGALTDEIMQRCSGRHFDLEPSATTELARQWLEQQIYTVLLAIDEPTGDPVGCATLCESQALYAGGSFGIIQEFYVVPAYRSCGIGALLLVHAESYGRSLGWQRLELCTPPLPAFARTLDFYTANGFEVTGGRKLKRLLEKP